MSTLTKALFYVALIFGAAALGITIYNYFLSERERQYWIDFMGRAEQYDQTKSTTPPPN